MRYLSPLVAFATLCSFAPGQLQKVIPAGFAQSEGQTATQVPFGLSTPVRMQCIYHAAVPGNQLRRQITEIAIRADGNTKRKSGWSAKKFVEFDLFVGQCPLRYDRVSSKFEDNRTGASKLAFRGKIDLPAQPANPGNGPRPFVFRIKPATPIFHENRDDGYFMLEFVVGGQPKGSYPLDSPFVCRSPGTPLGKIGARCKFSNGKAPIVKNSTHISLGGSITWTLENAPARTPTLFVSGSRTSGPFLGGNLPTDLSAFGATGCYANMDWAFIFAKLTGSSGVANYTFPLPNLSRLRGAPLFGQFITLDLAANRMGVVWSQGRQAKICGPAQCSRVIAIRDLKAKRGIVQIGSAPILRLTYK